LRFASLGSGSRGNATVVCERHTCVLVDCGFSVTQIEKRLARLELEPQHLCAIVITHEHADHFGSAGPLSLKYRIPVWLTHGTLANRIRPELVDPHYFHVHAQFELGDLIARPFPVVHDAREPCQFVFDNGAEKLGILTDTGTVTPHILQSLSDCDALMVECNYDPKLLSNGPYPETLKARIRSDYGHLSNAQAGALLQRLQPIELQHLVAAHVSEKNNRPELASEALATGCGCHEEDVMLAGQETGTGWLEI